jgi:phage shock protein PspC (stress-responsive transcriptional regulator)
MTEQQHRLYRSQTNKVIAGVCGGLAEYLNVDTTIVRLVWVLLTLLGGSGIILYVLAFFIIPERPIIMGDAPSPMKSEFGSARIFGILFVAAGVVLLLDNLGILSFCRIWDTTWEFVLPGILMLAGIYFLTKRGKLRTTLSEQASPGEQGQSTENQVPPQASSTEQATNPKVFRRSLSDKKVFGICGGAGEYFGIDSTILRIAYAIFTVFSGGMGIILYFLMYLIVPEGQPQQNKQE